MDFKMDYDVPKEMSKNKNKSDRILNDFAGVDGLSSVLDQTLDLIDSENMEVLCKTLPTYVEKFSSDKDNMDRINSDSFSEDLPQLDYAQTLQKLKIFYIPSIWGDTILFETYNSLNIFLEGILSMKKSDHRTSVDEVLNLANKVMILLDDFDENENFIPPNQEYFNKLKRMKWNKKANKLLENIFDIYTKISDMIIETPVIDSHMKFLTNSRFCLIFLTACSAINSNNSKMEVENVIHAYKTYYKILDANINDLL
jgi:hypothetical protein